MEVTTASPSPASATEGDDLCEIDVTNVAIHSVTLLISLCGLVSLVSCVLWLYTLTFFSTNRGRSIHCPLWHCCHHPQHLSKVMYALLRTFSITLIFAMTISLCMSQLSEYCWLSLISMYTHLLLFAPAMVISSTILLSEVKCGSHQQQPKRLNIVVCLTVLFTLPPSLWNFLQGLTQIIVPSQVIFLLASIHSSINPFICFLAGRCWRPCSLGSLRLSLQRLLEEPEENSAHSNDPAMDTVL
ncbi:LOW QUALITY PROTEIN: proto-oncogene Mas-like [Sylvia borin]